jgi:hypothetical protein
MSNENNIGAVVHLNQKGVYHIVLTQTPKLGEVVSITMPFDKLVDIIEGFKRELGKED